MILAMSPASHNDDDDDDDDDNDDDDDDNDGSSKQAPPFCLAVHAPPAAQTCSCSNNKTFCLAKLYKF